jgi:hypothetical protein
MEDLVSDGQLVDPTLIDAVADSWIFPAHNRSTRGDLDRRLDDVLCPVPSRG